MAIDPSKDIHLEEFRVLRAEILQRIQLQHNIVTFSLTLLALSLTTLGSLISLKIVDEQEYFVLLIIPFAFYAFPLAFREQDFMISTAAKYINTDLRKRLADSVKVEESKILAWDAYLWDPVRWTGWDLIRANSRYAFLFLPNVLFIVLFAVVAER